MHNKQLEYIQGDHDSEVFSFLGEEEGLTKTASYDGKVAEFLANLDRKQDKLYALINALSAGEYYGPNRNGDYFPEQALKKHHNTFVDYGHVYKHHVNKDPKKSMGKVIFSHFNDGMKRVELVAELDKNHDGVQDIIRKLTSGEVVKTSMGCKVPYDVCSCCGKKAKTRAEYCDHLKKKMGKVLPDGRRVSAVNTKPRFFDISIVTIPADPISSFMGYFGMDKTASVDSSNTKSAEDKSAEMEKELPMTVDDIEEDPKNLIRDSQGRFTDEQIEKLSQYPLNETLSTFLGLRILPERDQFQKLALYSMGKKEMADELEKQGEVFNADLSTKPEVPNDLGPEYCNIKVAEDIYQDIPKFSLTKRDIINRIIEKTANLKDEPVKVFPDKDKSERSFISKALFNKEEESEKSPVKSPMIPMMTMGALYAGYTKLFGASSSPTGFTKFMHKNPWLAPIVVGGIAYGSTKLQEEEYKKSPLYDEAMQEQQRRQSSLQKQAGVDRFVTNMMVTTPLSYYGSMKAEEKAMRGQPINNFEDFVRKHPLPTAFGSALVAGSVMKNLGKAVGKSGKAAKKSKEATPFYKRAEHINSLKPEIINQIYNELIHKS